MLEQGYDGCDEDGGDACVDEEFFFWGGAFVVAEAGALIGVFDGGVDACEEFLVYVDADGGGLENLADLGVVDAGVVGESCWVYV